MINCVRDGYSWSLKPRVDEHFATVMGNLRGNSLRNGSSQRFQPKLSINEASSDDFLGKTCQNLRWQSCLSKIRKRETCWCPKLGYQVKPPMAGKPSRSSQLPTYPSCGVTMVISSLGWAGAPGSTGDALKMELTDSNFKKALEGKNAGGLNTPLRCWRQFLVARCASPDLSLDRCVIVALSRSNGISTRVYVTPLHRFWCIHKYLMNEHMSKWYT